MTLDDLTRGQRDGTTLLQKGVQTNQHTGLGNDGRLLNFHQVSVLQCLDKISLHIGVGLTGTGFFLSRLTQRLDLFCDHIHNNGHAVTGCCIIVRHSGQSLEHTGRIEIHILQVRQVHDLCHISIVDTAHGHEHFPLLIQICITRGHAVRFGEHHTNKVEHLRGSGTGILHVRQM